MTQGHQPHERTAATAAALAADMSEFFPGCDVLVFFYHAGGSYLVRSAGGAFEQESLDYYAADMERTGAVDRAYLVSDTGVTRFPA